MSNSSEGRERVAAHIPAALRAVLTAAQQFLLLDTVMPVTVGDLRRAILDPAYAAQLTRRPQQTQQTQQPQQPQQPVEMSRAFTPRPASQAELAETEERRAQQGLVASAQDWLEDGEYSTAAQFRQAVIRRRAAAAEADRVRQTELRLRLEAETAARRQRQEDARQRQEDARRAAESSRRTPNQRQPNTRTPQPFSDAIRSIAQSTRHQPGHVPVLGGQADAREASLTAARANRPAIDWGNTTRWRCQRPPRNIVPIAAMSDQQLADEIDDTIAHVVRIFQLYAEGVWQREPGESALSQAKRWLAVQAAFRALVQEAVRRDVALYGASTAYVLEFVLGASSNAQLADFVNHPVRVVTEESVVDTFGRSGRALRLDDD